MNHIEELAKQVIEALKSLASKIGQGAEAVYRMAVKDAFINGMEDLFWAVFGVCLLTIVPWKLSKWWGDPEIDKQMPSIMGSIFALLIGGVILMSSLGGALHNIFNPEYMALKDLLASIHK